MHLAELNIARLRYPADDIRVAPFMDALDLVNGVAERAPGFVWRLKDDSGNATSIEAFPDRNVIANMSVWRDIGSFENFVWKTVHKQFYARRDEWFSIMDRQHFVMWQIEAGHVPSLAEAKARLGELNKHGNSDAAFGWSHLPEANLWKMARCA